MQNCIYPCDPYNNYNFLNIMNKTLQKFTISIIHTTYVFFYILPVLYYKGLPLARAWQQTLVFMIGQNNRVSVWSSIVHVHCTLFRMKNLDYQHDRILFGFKSIGKKVNTIWFQFTQPNFSSVSSQTSMLFLFCRHRLIMVHFMLFLSNTRWLFWFKYNCWLQINRKMVDTIWFWLFEQNVQALVFMIGDYNGVGVWSSIVKVHFALFQLKNIFLTNTERKLLSSKWNTDDNRSINDYLMCNMATLSEKKLMSWIFNATSSRSLMIDCRADGLTIRTFSLPVQTIIIFIYIDIIQNVLSQYRTL